MKKPKDDAVLCLGIESEVPQFVNKIKKELSAVKDWGLSDAIKGEIDEVLKMVDGLGKSFAEGMDSKLDSKTFSNFEKKINAEVDKINKRVGTLETTMATLIETTDGVDKTKFAITLETWKSGMSDLTTATKEALDVTKEVIETIESTGGKASFKTQKKALEEEKNILKEIVGYSSKLKANRSERGITGQVNNALAKYKEAKDKYLKATTKGSDTFTTDKVKLSEIRKEVVKTATDLIDLEEQSKKKDITWTGNNGVGPFTAQVRKDLTQANNDVIQFVTQAQRRLANIEKGVGTQPEASYDEESRSVKVPLVPDITKEDFWPKVKNIIDYTQNQVDKRPLQIDFELKSKYSSKKTNKVLKEWQEQINTLDDEGLKSQFQDLYDTVAKELQKHLRMSVTSDVKDEGQKVQNVIDEISKKLKSKRFKIFPTVDFSEVDVEKLQKKLDTVAKKLKLNLTKYNFNDQEVKFVEQFEEMKNELLSPIASSLNEIVGITKTLNEVAVNTEGPIKEITQSVRELVLVLQQAFGITAKVDLDGMFSQMENAVANINGRLWSNNKAKNPLVEQLKEVLDFYRKYQELGGTKTLGDLGGAQNVQNWFKNHKDDELENVGNTLGLTISRGIRLSNQVVVQSTQEVVESVPEAAEEVAPAVNKVLEELGGSFGEKISEGILESKDKIKKALKELVDDETLSLIDLSSDDSFLSDISKEVYEEIVNSINTVYKDKKLKAIVLNKDEKEARKQSWADALSDVGIDSRRAELNFEKVRNENTLSINKDYYEKLSKVLAFIQKEVESDRGSKELREYVDKLADTVSYLKDKIKEAETPKKKFVGKKKDYSRYIKKDDVKKDSTLSMLSSESLNSLFGVRKPEKKLAAGKILKLLDDYRQTANTEFLNEIKTVAKEAKLSSHLQADIEKELERVSLSEEGKKKAEEFVEGVESAKSDASKAGAGLAEATAEGVAEEAEIKSPSRVAERLGEYWGEGYVKGILNTETKVKNAIRALYAEGKLDAEDLARDYGETAGASTIALDEIIKEKKETKVITGMRERISNADKDVDTFIGTLNMFKGSKAYEGIENIEEKITTLVSQVKTGAKDVQAVLNELFNKAEKAEPVISSLEQELKALDVGSLDFKKVLSADTPEQLVGYYRGVETYLGNLRGLINQGMGSDDFLKYVDKVAALLRRLQEKLSEQGWEKHGNAWENIFENVIIDASKVDNKMDEVSADTSNVNNNLNETVRVLNTTTKEAGEILTNFPTTGALKSQIGDAAEKEYSYIQSMLDGVLETTVSQKLVKDEDDIIRPQKFETVRVNYQKLEKELINTDKKIIELSHRIAKATEEEAAPLRENLSLLEQQQYVYEELLKYIVSSDFYKYDKSSLSVFNEKRTEASKMLVNENRSKDIVETNKQLEKQKLLQAQINTKVTELNKLESDLKSKGITTDDISKLRDSLDEVKDGKKSLSEWNEELKQFKNTIALLSPEVDSFQAKWDKTLGAINKAYYKSGHYIDAKYINELYGIDNKTDYFADSHDKNGNWTGELARDVVEVSSRFDLLLNKYKELVAAEKEIAKQDKLNEKNPEVYANSLQKAKDRVSEISKEIEQLKSDNFLDKLSDNQKSVLDAVLDALDEIKQKQEATLHNSEETAVKAEQKIRNAINKANESSKSKALSGIIDLKGDRFRKNFVPEIREEINELQKEFSRLYDLGNKGNIIPKEEIDNAVIRLRQLKNDVRDTNKYFAETKDVTAFYSKIADFMNNNTAMSREFKDELRDIMSILKSGEPILESELANLQSDFNRITGQVRELGETGNSLFTSFVKQLRSANAQFLTTYFSFQDWIRYARQAVTTVKELDYALVDLRKTTSMTREEVNEFYFSANDVARELGTTTQDIIEQASAWSRLGYSTKEAATEMAALSSKFALISPGMDLDTATDGLVSTMKAFHIDVQDVEREIMDVVNKTGNTMATSNDEVVRMLERSSAAMASANNTLKETIALESAAVQITRNAETTGTAFRTISMRIRGFDEETEEYIGDVEELSGKIADLTKTASTPGGISLFTDATKKEYKSTYQILKDISAIYNQLTDKNQAALLETLAGKRGGQVLAGILEDFSEVEKAMTNMENAAGSASAEVDIAQESLAHKLNALKETWVRIAQELFDRKLLAYAIDFLTKISEIIEQIVSHVKLLGTLGAAAGAFAIFKKISDTKKSLTLALNGIQQIGTAATAATEATYGMSEAMLSVGTAAKMMSVGIAALGAVAVIYAATKAWDYFNVTVAETEEEIDRITGKLDELNAEIEELNNIDDKSDAQKDRLSLLESELDIQKQLLEIQQQRKLLEQTDNKFTDYFDKDNWNTKISSYEDVGRYQMSNANKYRLNRFESDKKAYEKYAQEILEIDEKLNDSNRSENQKAKDRKDVEQKGKKKDELERRISKYYLESYEEYLDLVSTSKEIDQMLETMDENDPMYQVLDGLSERYKVQIDDLRNYLVEAMELLGKDTSALTLDTRFAEANEKIVKDSQHDLDVLTFYTKDFSNEQKEAWIKATEGANNANEAIEKYENSLEETGKVAKNVSIETPIINSVADINTKLKAQFDQLSSAYNAIFNGDKGFDLSAVDNDLLKGISDSFVSSAVENELLSQEEALAATEKFTRVLVDQKSTAEDVQQAFNDLATSYFYSADGLEKLNDENKDAIKQQLKKLGVSNADAVVDAYIEFKINSQAFENTKQEVADKMRELEKGGDVNLLMRPVIDAKELNKVGWDAGEGVATVFSSTFSNETGDVAINVTPILPDGQVLTPKQLEEYANAIIEGVNSDDIPDIQIGAKFTGSDAIQQAVDAAQKIHELQDVYYNLDDIILNITEDTAAEAEARLEAVGAVNAHKLVTDALTAKLEAEALEAEAVEAATSDMAGETTNASEKFVQEAQMSNLAKVQLANLVAAQTVFNQQGLSVEDKIQDLSNLANAYLGTAAQASFLNKVSNTAAGGHGTISPELAWQQVMEEFSLLNFEGIQFDATDAASKGGSDAADAWVEAYEKEKKALQRDRDMGLISEKEYLDKLKALIDKFFKDRAKYAENYLDEMKEYMDALLSHYNSVVSAVVTLLDNKINKLQKDRDNIVDTLTKEKEAAEEALQTEIDGIQKEIDALDELIEKKNEQIEKLQEQVDAINEANEARQRAINLQKAEYELQRAQNQRTKLVYTGEVGTMRYEADQGAVRDAQDQLKQAQDEIAIAAIEKQIKAIEKQIKDIEKHKKALEDEQKLLQKQLEETTKYYEKLIKEQEKFFDEQIKKLEETKAKWEELAQLEEISKAWGLVSDEMAELGFTVEDVLNDTPGAFEAFKERYLKVLAEMHSGDKGFLEGLKENAGAIPEKFDELATAVEKAKEPLGELDKKAGTASDNVSKLGGSAGTASTKVSELGDSSKTASGEVKKLDEQKLESLNQEVENVNTKIHELEEAVGGPGKGLYGALSSLNNIKFDTLKQTLDTLKQDVKDAADEINNTDFNVGGTGTGGTKPTTPTTGENVGPELAGGKFTSIDLGDSFDNLVASVKLQDAPTMKGIKSTVSEFAKAVSSEVKNIATSSTDIVQNNTFNISGVTGEEVAQKINTTLMQTFSGMSLNAYQRSMA